MIKHTAMKMATAFVLGVCVLVTPQLAQALTLETISSWNGVSYIWEFGEPDTATYGQTLTFGQNVTLNSFSFLLNDEGGADVVDFRAYIADWNGTNIDNVLWSSDPYSTTNNGGADGFEQFTFLTGGVNLLAGEYVIFLSASTLFDGLTGLAQMATVNGATYAGGSFVFMNNSSNLDLLFTETWSQWSDDTAFAVDYTLDGRVPAVLTPEPSTFILLGAGLLGLVGLGRKNILKG